MTHLPQTDRLYFREFTLEDAELLYKMHQDPAVWRYTGDKIPWSSIEQAKQILNNHILPQYEKQIGRWAVHLKLDDTFIGWCGLKEVEGEVDLGYRYIQHYWGRGYATEAAKAVLTYGIKNKINNIVGRAAIANKASVTILEKIGLTFAEFYQQGDVASVKYVWKPES